VYIFHKQKIPVKRVSALLVTQERTDNLIFNLSYHWIHITVHHRVDRVLGFFSSRPNWDYPTPHRRRVCPPLPLVPGDTLACVRGGGRDPNSDEGTDTVVYTTVYIRMYFVLYSI
jgi:hypothetical protein